MTLKSKSLFLSILALLLASISFLLYLQHKSINDDLFNAVILLDDIKDTAYELEFEIIHDIINTSSAKHSLEKIPSFSKKIKDLWRIKTTPKHLIELEISFVRIERLIDKSLPGQTKKQPLLKQIDLEILKIHNSVDKLLEYSRQRLDILKNRADLLTLLQFFALLIYSVSILFFPIQSIITPLLNLSRQVKSVDSGKKENITIPDRNDEIGTLYIFIHKTISGLLSQGNELRQSKENLNQQYQQQLAFSKILELSITIETMDDFLEKTMKTVLSLDWLKIKNKGGIFLVNDKDESNKYLSLEYSHNFDESIEKSCAKVPFGKCLCGRVAQSQEFLHTKDIDDRHEIRYENMSPHGHYGIPIIFNKELLGVMVLYLEPNKEAQTIEIEFLKGIANIIAQAISRKRLEDKQLLISTAIDQAGEGVIITDNKGIIQYINPLITTLTGYSPQELLDHHIGKLKSFKDDHDFYKMIFPYLNSDEVLEDITSNIKKDGTYYDERIIVSAIKNKQNQVTNYVAIKRDITREKILEAQLLHSQKLEAIGTLAGGIAHDFNNILTTIIGYCDIVLASVSPDDKNLSNLEAIMSSGERAATLVNQLMLFSRKQNLIMEPTDLNVTVEYTTKMLQRLLEGNIILHIEITKGLGEILADTSHIEQVLANLVVNAKDAMPQGGTLTIETDQVSFDAEHAKKHKGLRPGQYVRLTVTDTGIGIPYEIQEHIFEPFFTTKETGEGTGLGLATIYGIIEQHQGHIDLYSDPGYGTSFQILFPVIQEDTTSIPTVTEELIFPESSHGTEMILLADEDPNNRRTIMNILKPLGYKVIEASYGKEAIEISQAWPESIDLLLSEAIMSGIKGEQLARSIRSKRPKMDVIYMTSNPDKDMILKKILSSQQILLNKPIDPKILVSTIRKVLDSKQNT